MRSNEDAEIRKHVYKPLKRRSPTPLYYPLTMADNDCTLCNVFNCKAKDNVKLCVVYNPVVVFTRS